MIEWTDEGLILSVLPYGEHAAVLHVFTREQGRYAGLLPGAQSRRLRGGLQTGLYLRVECRARLDAQLGTFKGEPLEGLPSPVLLDRAGLAGLASVVALLQKFLMERDPHPALYNRTRTLLEKLLRAEQSLFDWGVLYARWERDLLGDLGFGLDLGCCTLTGAVEDLAFVSPRTGCAVTRTAGRPWADRLIPLPAFLGNDASADVDDTALRAALRLTGFFLERALDPVAGAGKNPGLPSARSRLLARLENQQPL